MTPAGPGRATWQDYCEMISITPQNGAKRAAGEGTAQRSLCHLGGKNGGDSLSFGQLADRAARLRAAVSRHASRVGEEGFEPSRPLGHTDLNRARLPFRHPPREQQSG